MKSNKVKKLTLTDLLTGLAFVAGISFSSSAFAEPPHVEEIIRRERAKVGAGIDALDSMITQPSSNTTEPSSYVPARYAAPTEEAPDRFKALPPSKDEIIVKGEDGIRGEDVVAEQEEKPEPVRIRPEPLFDMGSAKIVPVISKPQVSQIVEMKPSAVVETQPSVPARLTDSLQVRADVAPEKAQGFWDDLNSARERVRRTLAESWGAEERPKPVNYPAGYADTNQIRQEMSAAERLAPQQAGIGIGVPRRSPAEDAIAAEVKEVEQEIHGSQGQFVSNSNGEVPVLRPKYLVRLPESKRMERRVASALSRNQYARGARAGEARKRNDEETYQPSTYKYVPENYYRHLTPQNGVGHAGKKRDSLYGDSAE